MRIASFTLKLLLAAAILSLPAAARADTFSWAVISGSINGTGTFTATPNGSIANAFNITSVSGSVNGSAVTGVVPGNYDPINPSRHNFADGLYFDYDNIYYAFGSSFDVHGLLFQLANGIYINMYTNGKTPTVGMLNGDPTFDSAHLTPVEATINAGVADASVPEPSTFILLGTGLTTLVSTLRRKKSSL